MPKFETADSDVPEQKYKELSKIVGNYWQKNKDMTMSQINQHQITTSLKIKKKIIKQIMIVNNQRMKIQK